MINRDAVEKALLLGIVRDKNWKVLILNNVSKDYFTYANHGLFEYIEGYVQKNSYPELKVIQQQFDITNDEMSEYIDVNDLEGLCNVLKNNYLQSVVRKEVVSLNEYQQYLETEPIKYVEQLGVVYNNLKLIGQSNKSVGLLDNINEILKINPNDVISTGFKELDEALIGWKRGEELAVFMARTNQGKSWFGLKFALSAALKGERVGIYSGEMSQQQLQERIICCGKPSYTATKEDSLAFLQNNNVDIRLLTQRELRRRANVTDIEEFIIRDNLTMLVIDQLSLMEDDSSKPGTPLRQQYGNITNDLFSLSSRYNLPIILLVQSNRNGAQEQNGPTIENIAESDAVGQNATRVISMRNDSGIISIKVVKNRYGPVDMQQKYEVDFGINKYKPIREIAQEDKMIRKAKARQIFGGGSAF